MYKDIEDAKVRTYGLKNSIAHELNFSKLGNKCEHLYQTPERSLWDFPMQGIYYHRGCVTIYSTLV